jgi:hypothetical protein
VADDTLYTARFVGPTLIEQGRDTPITCPVYRDGVLVTPASGTVTIYDASGVALVSAAPVVPSGSVAGYTVAAGTTSGRSKGPDWRVEWSLVVASQTRLFSNEAALVSRRLYPAITDADIYARHRALNPSSGSPLTSLTTYQAFVDDAWITLLNRILADGTYPQKVPSPAALRETHLALVLARIFADLASASPDQYAAMADSYRRQYDTEYRAMRFVTIEEGEGAAGNVRKAADPIVLLAPRRYWWGR